MTAEPARPTERGAVEDDEHGDIVTIAYMMGAKAERDRQSAALATQPATGRTMGGEDGR